VSRIAPTARGVEIQLSSAEIAILSRLPSLLGSVGSDPTDPAPKRLHPAAYPNDEEGSAELARLTKDDLAEGRTADVDVFARQLPETGDGITISSADAEAWMRVLGSARIVLASRRGLFDLEDLAELPNDDPDVALVNLLGAYQQTLAEVLLAAM
jgi:hypothetical protein